MIAHAVLETWWSVAELSLALHALIARQGRVPLATDFAKVDADLTNSALGPHIVAGLSWVLGLP